MLKIEIKKVEPKSFTLADVKPGERFRFQNGSLPYGWCVRLAQERHNVILPNPGGPGSFYAYCEGDKCVWSLGGLCSGHAVTIEGREPAKPAEVPISHLKPSDVFETNKGVFIKTKRSLNDTQGYEYALMVKSHEVDSLGLFMSDYSFSSNTLVRPITDATLTITI